jgi:hypothetical protein
MNQFYNKMCLFDIYLYLLSPLEIIKIVSHVRVAYDSKFNKKFKVKKCLILLKITVKTKNE